MRDSSLLLRWSWWWLGLAASWLISDSAAAAEAQKAQCLAAYSESQELRLQGSLLAARESLLICSQNACPAPVVDDCAGWLGEVERSLPSVVFAVSDELGRDVPDARVSARDRVLWEHDEGRALTLDPGRYVFTFSATGFEPAQQTVVLRQSEKNRIVRVELTRLSQAVAEPKAPSAAIELEPAESTAKPIPTATFILGGVALASVGAFTYFGLAGLDKEQDANSCQSMCQALIDDGRRDYVIADVALGVGIAAATSAVVVYLLSDGEPAATPTALQREMPYVRISF